jgi:hypothetical protein
MKITLNPRYGEGMNTNNFHRISPIALAIAFFALSLPVAAQAPVQVVVSAGVQQNPAGFTSVNNDVWFGDRINGVLHYAPDDRANPNPLDTGTYHADPNSIYGIEGVCHRCCRQ